MLLPDSNVDCYVDHDGVLHPIKNMSDGFIKNQLEYIEHTQNNLIYQDRLKQEYKIRIGRKFKPLIDKQEDYENI